VAMVDGLSAKGVGPVGERRLDLFQVPGHR
jgi:hypothetical protein